jgi:triosephosphate isomerase
VTGQVREAFVNVSPEGALNVVMAYEPIWAIGTGRAATAEEANRVCGLIRKVIEELYGAPTPRESASSMAAACRAATPPN